MLARYGHHGRLPDPECRLRSPAAAALSSTPALDPWTMAHLEKFEHRQRIWSRAADDAREISEDSPEFPSEIIANCFTDLPKFRSSQTVSYFARLCKVLVDLAPEIALRSLTGIRLGRKKIILHSVQCRLTGKSSMLRNSFQRLQEFADMTDHNRHCALRNLRLR